MGNDETLKGIVNNTISSLNQIPCQPPLSTMRSNAQMACLVSGTPIANARRSDSGIAESVILHLGSTTVRWCSNHQPVSRVAAEAVRFAVLTYLLPAPFRAAHF